MHPESEKEERKKADAGGKIKTEREVKRVCT
jgi:hypothetical protein